MLEKKEKKLLKGVVISDKMNKSRVVVVEKIKKHPVYGKYVRRRKKYMIHDEKNESKTGDVVLFKETRPISKRKKWMIVEVLKNVNG